MAEENHNNTPENANSSNIDQHSQNSSTVNTPSDSLSTSTTPSASSSSLNTEKNGENKSSANNSNSLVDNIPALQAVTIEPINPPQIVNNTVQRAQTPPSNSSSSVSTSSDSSVNTNISSGSSLADTSLSLADYDRIIEEDAKKAEELLRSWQTIGETASSSASVNSINTSQPLQETQNFSTGSSLQGDSSSHSLNPLSSNEILDKPTLNGATQQEGAPSSPSNNVQPSQGSAPMSFPASSAPANTSIGENNVSPNGYASGNDISGNYVNNGMNPNDNNVFLPDEPRIGEQQVQASLNSAPPMGSPQYTQEQEDAQFMQDQSNYNRSGLDPSENEPGSREPMYGALLSEYPANYNPYIFGKKDKSGKDSSKKQKDTRRDDPRDQDQYGEQDQYRDENQYRDQDDPYYHSRESHQNSRNDQFNGNGQFNGGGDFQNFPQNEGYQNSPQPSQGQEGNAPSHNFSFPISAPTPGAPTNFNEPLNNEMGASHNGAPNSDMPSDGMPGNSMSSNEVPSNNEGVSFPTQGESQPNQAFLQQIDQQGIQSQGNSAPPSFLLPKEQEGANEENSINNSLAQNTVNDINANAGVNIGVKTDSLANSVNNNGMSDNVNAVMPQVGTEENANIIPSQNMSPQGNFSQNVVSQDDAAQNVIPQEPVSQEPLQQGSLPQGPLPQESFVQEPVSQEPLQQGSLPQGVNSQEINPQVNLQQGGFEQVNNEQANLEQNTVGQNYGEQSALLAQNTFQNSQSEGELQSSYNAQQPLAPASNMSPAINDVQETQPADLAIQTPANENNSSVQSPAPQSPAPQSPMVAEVPSSPQPQVAAVQSPVAQSPMPVATSPSPQSSAINSPAPTQTQQSAQLPEWATMPKNSQGELSEAVQGVSQNNQQIAPQGIDQMAQQSQIGVVQRMPHPLSMDNSMMAPSSEVASEQSEVPNMGNIGVTPITPQPSVTQEGNAQEGNNVAIANNQPENNRNSAHAVGSMNNMPQAATSAYVNNSYGSSVAEGPMPLRQPQQQENISRGPVVPRTGMPMPQQAPRPHQTTKNGRAVRSVNGPNGHPVDMYGNIAQSEHMAGGPRYDSPDNPFYDQLDIFAIIGFISAILGIWFSGVIFGIFGIWRVKQLHTRGMGYAIAAVVIGVIEGVAMYVAWQFFGLSPSMIFFKLQEMVQHGVNGALFLL